MGSFLVRALSWFWPIPVARAEGKHGPMELRWEAGRKVLNSANANQSFGSLHRVWQKALRQAGLAGHPPVSVLLLGLGGGSVLHILRHELGILAPVTAVELDPAVIGLAEQHFGLKEITGLTVIEGDAMVQVHALGQRFDLVVVDLFDDLDLARGVDSRAFAHGLRDRCADGGQVLVNTVAYDEASKARRDRVRHHLDTVFQRVEEWRMEEVNHVLVAR
jgi:spermidine synthase